MSRSTKHEVPIDRVGRQALEEKAAESYQDDELKRTLRSVIATLSESDQHVLTLHYIHGLTCKEIGRYFGTSARAMEMRLYRARRQLKKEMLSTTQAEKSENVVFARQKPEHRLKGNFTFDLLKSIQQEGITPHQPSTKPSWGAPLSMSLAGLTILCMVSLGIGTSDVGSAPAGASAYGVHDMAGNVREWVDGWGIGVNGLRSRVVRGSSWRDYKDSVRCMDAHVYSIVRNGLNPSDVRQSFTGFRVAIDANELPQLNGVE